MPTFPTIAANTPFNNAATLSAVVAILDERWRCAGSPGKGPRSVWFEFAEADGYTVSGEYDAETDTTALAFLPSTPPMGPDPAGRRLVIDGVGEVTLIDASTAAGDAACTDAAVSMPAKGNKIDAAFWSTLQNCAIATIPCYLDSYTYALGFAEGDYALGDPIFFAVDLPAFLEAASVNVFPRRVRARGPCSFTYDAESDTTTVVDLNTTEENAPDFSADHVGMRLDVFGIGQFAIESFVDEATVVISGRVERSNTVVSVLPDDPLDLDDPAYGAGVCASGDVQGPWLLYDLLAVMAPLEWTSPSGRLGQATDNHRSGSGYSTESVEAAKADAETAYGETLTTLDAGPSATVAVTTGGGSYLVEIARTKSKGYWSVPEDSAPLTFDVDIYAAATVPMNGIIPGDFDGCGDFPDADTVILCLSESGVTDRTGSTTATFGSLALPGCWPSTWTMGDGIAGYVCAGTLVVAKWHFTHTA